jgi:hypothetical protein
MINDQRNIIDFFIAKTSDPVILHSRRFLIKTGIY